MRSSRNRAGRSSVKVVAGPDGIAISRFWNGTLLLPWELIRDVRVVNIKGPGPKPGYLRVQLVLADGSVRFLPAPAASAEPYDARFHAAINAIYEQRHLYRERAAANPEDAPPTGYYALQVWALTHRGGARRNGLLHAMIALFGMLGVLFMVAAGHEDFGPQGAFGPVPACSATAAIDGTAPQSWCTVTDARVLKVDRDGSGGVTDLLIGPASQLGEPIADATTVDAWFGAAQPAFDDIAVGDPIGAVGSGQWEGDGSGDFDFSLVTVTWQGKVVPVDCGADCATPQAQRMADLSGLGASIVWPVFFGLWALRIRLRRAAPGLRWVLPSLAACWLAGLVGYIGDDQTVENLTPAAVGWVALVLAAVLTLGYGIRSAIKARTSSTVLSGVTPPTLRGSLPGS
ncbi:hypothetical protein KDL01_35540 [Actinospica durhamensis]|uniref:Uncharacterized protein n=1 Tax=Actinospica durhamensis TaxID=1508375 RepID=A0A941EWN6_9ACTN|nr:hypothetical protein [Actinospica durhamensis]MBR7838636.1 hypothetical protein [Actinospica durhamensis]